jgi:hypothetical protein
MKRDKAIIKALDRLDGLDKPSLSADFNVQLMNKISKAAAKREKRSFIVNIAIVTVVSLGLVVMAVYLLRNYLTTDITFSMPVFHIGSVSHYLFFAYIAILALLLLGLDYFFRYLREKKNDNYIKHSH